MAVIRPTGIMANSALSDWKRSFVLGAINIFVSQGGGGGGGVRGQAKFEQEWM